MKFADFLKETSNASSTATIALAGAVAGFLTLAKVISNGNAANDANAIKVNDSGVPFVVVDSAGNRECGYYKITSPTVLTRESVFMSTNNGAPVTGWVPPLTVYSAPIAEWANRLLSLDDALTDVQLPAAPASVPDTWLTTVTDPVTGGTYKQTVAAARAMITGSGGTPADTVNPSAPGSLTSTGVTQTSATLNWLAATDNVGVAAYEITKDGATWTNVGNVLTYTYSGTLTAATTYPVQVRAIDAAGNRSTAASVSVTTAAAQQGGDTTNPSMSGSLTTSNVTSSGYTMNWTAGSDNVGVVGYDTSTDGGTTWSDAGNVTSRAISGATSGTLYNLRVRARDAVGLLSNVLSATVTTAPGQVTGLAAGTPTSNSVPLSWSAVSGAAAYTVNYRTTGSGAWTTASTTVTGTSYTPSGLSASQAYDFQVIATNAGGTGTASATVSATTAAAQAATYTLTGYGTTPNKVQDGPLNIGATGTYDFNYPPAGKGLVATKTCTNGYWYFRKNGAPVTGRVVSGWTRSPNPPTAADVLFFSTANPNPNPNSNSTSSKNGLVTSSYNSGPQTNVDNSIVWALPGDVDPYYLHYAEVDPNAPANAPVIFGSACANPNGLRFTNA
jgi:hypothetical protein